MSPLLYPLVLILVSEFSKDNLTQWVSRVMFYIYSLAMVVSIYFPSTSATLVVVMLVYLLGYSFLIYKVPFVRVRLVLSLLLILQGVNYLSLLLDNYVLYYSIPYYFEYSNIILRELSILCISLVCTDIKIDRNLKLSVVSLYLLEYYYLVNT